MKLPEHIRFRWNNNRDPLPGEVEPTESGTVIVWMSEVADVEPSLLLRKLRGLITGYGEGWTFAAALWTWLWPKLLVTFYTAAIIVVCYLVLKAW